MPIWEPGLAELVERHRDRLHFSTDLADALEHARLLFVAVGTPPTYSGDADLSAVHAVVDAMPASDRHALVMKSTVPVGTGETIQRVFAEQGKGFKYVSCPEFLKEGSAIKDFLEPDRVVVGDEGDWAGDAVVELYAPLERAAGAHGHQERRDGQARLQRVPGDEDLVHQRDRQRLRGDRRRRRRGRARDGAGQPHRAEVPAGRDRLRRLLLPQGRHGAEAARGQLGLPLPAAELGDRGQRAAEAARDRQAREAPRAAGRQGDRAARAGLQAEHRRHARGVLARALLAAAGGGRARARLRPGGRGRGPQADPRRRVRRDRAPTPSKAPTRSCSSPSGRSSPTLDLAAVAERDARQPAGRRAQPVRPRARARSRAGLRGDRRRGRAAHVEAELDAGAHPRRRRGDTAAAADLDGAEAGRPAGRPAVHHVHARLAARRTASTTS